MSLLIKLVDGVPTGHPLQEENVRLLIKTVSLPQVLTEAIIEPHGYGLFTLSLKPDLEKYKKAVEVTAVKNTEGVWVQTWAVEDMDDSEKAEADLEAAGDIRHIRNLALLQTDYQVLMALENNNAVPTELSTYRQALRDVPSQAGFPYNVTWPTAP
jgi:hypothetical protein